MKAISTILNIAIIAVFLMGASVIGPALETRMLPVYSTFKILQIVPAPDGKSSKMTVELRKLRNCVPQGYAWYATDLGNFTQQLNVVSNTRNPAPSLPLGKFITTFEIAGIMPKDLPTLYAETFSRCHPFWISRTVVFP